MNQSLRPVILGLCFTTLIGCGEWPRSGNLPDQVGDIEATDDPRNLFEVEWTAVDEVITEDQDDNDDPAASRKSAGTGALDFGVGIVVAGALDAVGWTKLAPKPSVPLYEECDNAQNIFDEIDKEGFYVGDLDYYVLSTPELDEPAALCAITESSNDALGWDLMLIKLNGCDNPAELIKQSDSDGILGYDMGGPSGYWAATVEANSEYAVVFAGYNDIGPEAIAYRIGATLIRPGSSAATTICPNLPAPTTPSEE